MKVGIIGVGNIGTVHLQTARSHPGVSRVTAVDPVASNRERAKRLGADATASDHERYLDRNAPDVTVIAAPPHLHRDLACASLEANAHVFVEKPFARTPSEAGDIVETAADVGRSLGVDHTLRYQPEMRRLKAIHEAGELGFVPTSSIWRINNGPFEAPPPTAYAPSWALDAEAAGGGALLDLGVHLLDVLEWFFGELSIEHATIDQVLEMPVEDAATLVLSTANGTTCTLTCGYFQWEEPPDITSGFRLDGIAESRNSTEFIPDRFTSHAAREALRNISRRLRGESPAYFSPTYYYQAHYQALTDFLDAIEAGEDPPVTGDDGRRMVELVHTAYEQAEASPPIMEATHD